MPFLAIGPKAVTNVDRILSCQVTAFPDITDPSYREPRWIQWIDVNTQLEPNLHRKQRLRALARVRSAGTPPWLGFEGVQPNRGVHLGKHCRINPWDGVASTV